MKLINYESIFQMSIQNIDISNNFPRKTQKNPLQGNPLVDDLS